MKDAGVHLTLKRAIVLYKTLKAQIDLPPLFYREHY